VRLGIGDDAALLSVPPGQELVASMDTLNEGVHFAAGADAGDIGYKALAVNLSDLAAMGARPCWCLLSLSIPNEEMAWVKAFATGFTDLANQHGVALVGGDTCRGPLSITVTALGVVDQGCAIKRSGAAPGDLVWVSGTPGEAAYALRLRLSGQPVPESLAWALDRPQPRLALGQALAERVSACIDVSDGLLADLGHVLDASHCGAELNLEKLPVSPGLEMLPAEMRWNLQLSGGDDYELCFTSPVTMQAGIRAAAHRTGTPVSVIGVIQEQDGVRCTTPDGQEFAPASVGFRHFGENNE
jgi:thiamine-monophosphate kinase